MSGYMQMAMMSHHCLCFAHAPDCLRLCFLSIRSTALILLKIPHLLIPASDFLLYDVYTQSQVTPMYIETEILHRLTEQR